MIVTPAQSVAPIASSAVFASSQGSSRSPARPPEPAITIAITIAMHTTETDQTSACLVLHISLLCHCHPRTRRATCSSVLPACVPACLRTPPRKRHRVRRRLERELLDVRASCRADDVVHFFMLVGLRPRCADEDVVAGVEPLNGRWWPSEARLMTCWLVTPSGF